MLDGENSQINNAFLTRLQKEIGELYTTNVLLVIKLEEANNKLEEKNEIINRQAVQYDELFQRMQQLEDSVGRKHKMRKPNNGSNSTTR